MAALCMVHVLTAALLRRVHQRVCCVMQLIFDFASWQRSNNERLS